MFNLKNVKKGGKKRKGKERKRIQRRIIFFYLIEQGTVEEKSS